MKNQLYINGTWKNAEDNSTFDVLNPATEEVIVKLPNAGSLETDLAIKAASQSFKVWKNTNAFDRAKLLKSVALKIREKAKEYAEITTKESGKPLLEATGEWMIAADLFEWFAEEAKRTYGTVIPASRNNKRMQVIYQPVGVVGIITAWNFPIWNLARPWGAALAAGCSIVAKPSEETPLTAILLAQIFEESALPKGVINLVFGNASEIGDSLMHAPEVKKMHFVGSTRVGKLLMDKASITNTKLSLELGGNAPVLVFPDVNIKEVAASSVTAKFRNCGQVCISPQRYIVHKDAYHAFIEEAAKHVANYAIGNGLNANSQIGPVINKKQQEQLNNFVSTAVASGAEVIVGGENHQENGKGYFFKPTLIGNVNQESSVFKNEIFGPIMAVTTFETMDEAISLANKTQYGLAAYIWTNNLNTAIIASEAIDFGIIGINEWTPHATEAPFGGMKESGQGSELGNDGIYEYLDKKLISIGSL
ncbi:NAD-dependent succinate-semialdehyde dehydrogenase [Maribacter sp. Asnod1-A12]|uniref:NAD-dependent succinate-semialdehyde dehydrogenase n=1 Tax=Maribacter sp. Asnod1-A12 TaxID=3160576 RepID=UPI003866C476